LMKVLLPIWMTQVMNKMRFLTMQSHQQVLKN
jgi:hypothetical protein